jgi:predicted esterase
VKAVDAAKAIIDVAFLDERGKSLGHKWAAYIGSQEDGDPPANHDWATYSSVILAPPQTKKLAIGLQIYGPGSVWFDELEIRQVGLSGDHSAPASSSTADGAAEGSTASTSTAAPTGEAQAIEIKVKDDTTAKYLLVPPTAEPAGLLLVLPGGDGSADFHPFVQRIAENALGGKYIVAQPIAPKWRDDQEITWPTLRNPVAGMRYAAEEQIGAVIRDVQSKHKFDKQRVFLLAWSSGGPAAYAIALHGKSPVTGSLIAMSVFRPQHLPSLTGAAKRSFYLLHSPQDEVCLYSFAKTAELKLKDAGAHVKLVDYQGGHGWQGDVFGNIRKGVEWLENSVAAEQ